MTVDAVEACNHKRFMSLGVPHHPKGLGVGYLITVEGKTIYHAGCTDFIPEMKQLNLRNIDLQEWQSFWVCRLLAQPKGVHQRSTLRA